MPVTNMPIAAVRRSRVRRRSLAENLWLGRVPHTLIYVVALTAMTAVLLAAGRGRLVLLTYPALALIIAVLLYLRTPGRYLVFTWWIWLLTPLVRRITDLHIGWTPVSTIMLTPYLVAGVASAACVVQFGNLAISQLLALVLIVSGLAYSFLIGAGAVGVAPAMFGLLTWIVPVLFGFYLAINWRLYEMWVTSTQAAFGYGALVIGIYGIAQFVFMPPWDAFWMLHSGMSSIGAPIPFEVRIFSTLNAPVVFAVFLMSGLILNLDHRMSVRAVSAIPASISLLLSQVRSAWLGLGIGLTLFLARMPLARSMKLIAATFLLLLAISPLVRIDAVQQIAMPRIMSLGALQTDHSLRARLRLYGEFFNIAAGNVIGSGIGSTNLATKLSNANGQLSTDLGVIDSGVIEVLFVLGWPGSFLYLGGVCLAAAIALCGSASATDQFIVAVRAIVIGILVQIVFFNMLGGAVGMIFWSFLGLLLAGQHYRRASSLVRP